MEINKEILFLPPKKGIVVVAESRHGHYSEDGTYTEVPLEVRPYNQKMIKHKGKGK